MAKRNSGGGSSGDGFDAPAVTKPRITANDQEFFPAGTVRETPIGLPAEARHQSVELLNQVVVDSIYLADMYKKHHWQVLGPTFYQLHLLFDKHADEQRELIDLLAERIQVLGGVTTAMPDDVAERKSIRRPPAGAEPPAIQLSRLLEAHEQIIREVREGIRLTEENEDWGTNDLLMSDVLRRHELQSWFISSHLVQVPVAQELSEESIQAADGTGATSPRRSRVA